MNELILVVEDDTYVLDNNRDFLRGKGYRTLEAETLAAARKIIAEQPVDLVLLDINLPDGTGFDFERDIPGHTPILYLTGRTDEEDVVRGLSRPAGHVDYLRKPFGYAEMGARVTALLSAAKDSNPARAITIGPLTIDSEGSRAFIEGGDLRLTQKEFALLLLLARKAGQTISGAALYEAVWSQPMSGDSNALRTQLSRLKKKLENASGGMITVFSFRGEGYSLDISGIE